MPLGFPVVVDTAHKNLIFPTETSLRVKRWKLFISECMITCEYIQGRTNVAADAFSRMEYDGVVTNKHDAELEALLVDPVDCVVDGKYIF